MIENLGKDFWYFRAGQFASLIGDIFASIAFSWWLMNLTNSIATVAKLTTVCMLIRLAVIPFMGPLIETFSRKLILIVADMLNGIMFLLLALIAFFHIGNIYVVASIYTLTGIFSALLGTAMSSFLIDVVGKDKFSCAMMYSSSISSIGQILGAAIGGVVVASFGANIAFLVNAISFFVAALMTFLINTKHKTVPQKKDIKIKYFFIDLKSGFLYLFSIKEMVLFLGFVLFVNILMAPISLFMPFLAKQHSNSPIYFSFLELGFSAGAIAGGFFFKKIKFFLKNSENNLFTVCLFVIGGAFIFMNILPYYLIPFFCLFPMGVSFLIGGNLIYAFFNASISDDFRARSNSLLYFILGLASPIGISLGGHVASGFGLPSMTLIFGSLVIVAAIVFCVIPFPLKKVTIQPVVPTA